MGRAVSSGEMMEKGGEGLGLKLWWNSLMGSLRNRVEEDGIL